ncbi:MAG: hypothetical protein KJO18_04545 [Acidimicrobiia bacterium]|nr:hypothetical protein [Acidimicrobiia bacterium]
MKTRGITLALAAASLGIAGAQEEAIDIEARKKSLPILEEHVKAREKRLTGIANEIVGLHRQLDGKLGRMVERLSNIKDSTKSGYRVSKIKMEAIEALQESIESYQSKRATVFQAIREGRTQIPKEILEGEVEHFDEHIEKHIEQVLEISKSFTQDKDVEKYKRIGGGGGYYGWGWSDDIYEISDEWYQNRRDRTMNKKQRAEVTEALKDSIDRCESLVAGLRNDLRRPNLTVADRELMQAEIDRHTAMLEKRQAQLDELLIVENPPTDPLSRDAALEVQYSLEDLTDDLQNDLSSVFLKHDQLNRERVRLYKLKANLEARKKWLADHEKKHPE